MIVRTLKDLEKSGSIIEAEGWISRRYLLKADGMGFSFHQTIIKRGAKLKMWYKNHLEAVLCINGKGVLKDLKSNTTWPVEPGTMYALNENDQHILEGYTEMTMICVFNPPLAGKETHNEEGSYQLDK